eukprot:7876005-Pyramimonas_sp.AAC.1
MHPRATRFRVMAILDRLGVPARARKLESSIWCSSRIVAPWGLVPGIALFGVLTRPNYPPPVWPPRDRTVPPPSPLGTKRRRQAAREGGELGQDAAAGDEPRVVLAVGAAGAAGALRGGGARR